MRDDAMYDEEDLLPLSALQHFVFCSRRAGLILLEGVWDENVATAEGTQLHKLVHASRSECRGDTRIVRGLLLRSLRLGLAGRADVVEFHRLNPGTSDGIELEGASGSWGAYPVEYKRGRRRPELSYEVQLCAQALCLEEMLGVTVPVGALFYGKTARRQVVTFDDGLRRQTEQAAEQLHRLIAQGQTPGAVYRRPKCQQCSLLDVCLPKEAAASRSVDAYVARMTLAECLGVDGEERR